MADLQKITYAKSYLRRTKTVEELKALADKVAQAVLTGEDYVSFTTVGADGASSSGELRMAPDIVGYAVEELLAELDPAGTKNPAAVAGSGAYADFSGYPHSV